MHAMITGMASVIFGLLIAPSLSRGGGAEGCWFLLRMAVVGVRPKFLVVAVAVNTGQDEPPAWGLQRRARVEELELPARMQVHREAGELTGEVPHRNQTDLSPDLAIFEPSCTQNFVRRAMPIAPAADNV